jgi:hypothetical protein
VKIDEEGGVTFTHIDVGSYFIRTRFNGDEKMLSLRAKLTGVAIEVKVIKDGVLAINSDIADALRELADVVSAAENELAVEGKADWSRTPGEPPKSLHGKDSDVLNDDSIEDAPSEGEIVSIDEVDLLQAENFEVVQ